VYVIRITLLLPDRGWCRKLWSTALVFWDAVVFFRNEISFSHTFFATQSTKPTCILYVVDEVGTRVSVVEARIICVLIIQFL
jgi:hypothetical protein